MSTDLINKQCIIMNKDTSALSESDINTLLPQISNDWQLSADKNKITRLFKFKNFHETIAFVNALAWVAHQQDHHPDLEVGYNKCNVHFTTHAVNGLSENDFICAARIDALL